MISDISAMGRALELARSGYCPPNPHVGCVLVRDGEIVGEGSSERVGGAHAEIVALRAAGERARGATAYVTLEPCNHQGRTGPCSLALIEAGLSRVVYAVDDPNPLAVGGGDRLRQAGVQVESGLLAAEAEQVHRVFLHAVRTGRPMVVVKSAITLDGRIALPNGESKWITSPEARVEAHKLRAELGAVLVGRGTVEKDDPSLTARIEGFTDPPVRIVLDPDGRLASSYRVFDNAAPTWRVGRGGEIDLNRKEDGTLDLPALLAELGSRGLIGLLVEGGGKTVSEFLRSGLVDRLELFMAPKLFGAGPSWVEGPLTKIVAAAPQYALKTVRTVGPDLWVTLARSG